MGCWTGTCGFSNLPIKDDEEVVFFFTNSLRTYGGATIDPYDENTPICLPMVGKYDGYGGVKDIIEDSVSSFNESQIRKLVNKDFTIKNFTKSVERSQHDNVDEIEDVRLVLVKKSLYDNITKDPKIIERFEKDIILYNNINDGFETIIDVGISYPRIFEFEMDYDIYLEIYYKPNDLIFLNVVKQFLHYNNTLDILRKTYNPGSGTGKQYFNIDNYKEIFKLFLDECDRY